MPMNRRLYPDTWDAIAFAIKTDANWQCQECRKPCRQPGESMDELYRRCVSYYYRWERHKGQVSEYIRAGQVTRVAGLIEAERPALEILRVVVEGKRKISGISAELLR